MIKFSKTNPSFLTGKEGSTFLTKPLFPQEREDVTALSAIFAPTCPSPAGESLTHSHALALSKRARDVTALRCSEPLRYKVGGASKPSPDCAGWDRMAVMGISLQLYCWKWVHGGGRLGPPELFPIAVSLYTCRRSNEEYYFLFVIFF